jgi:hypothetical protein
LTGEAGYPTDKEGWGRVLADDALYFPGDDRKLALLEDVRNVDGLSTEEAIAYDLTVDGSAEKLKVTLVWTDAPAAAGTSFAAVNDLDLEVEAPGGELYLGNVFSGGVSVTGGAKDDRNNVEQVHIESPETGLWQVRVVAAAVNEGTQGYALVATGDVYGGLPFGDGDFDEDGDVDLEDFAAFAECFGSAGVGGCMPGRMVEGDTIDLDDFGAFQAAMTGPLGS